MKKLFAAFVVTVVGASAHAAVHFEGQTSKGERCIVSFDSSSVSFIAPGVNFRVSATPADIQEAMDNDHFPIVLDDGDENNATDLSLTYNEDGTWVSATYFQWHILFPKKVTCRNLTEVK